MIANECPSNVAPPGCCEPMTESLWQERSRRLDAARQAVEASRPTRCPNVGCGSDDIFPAFVPTIDTFECLTCGNVFEALAEAGSQEEE